MRSRFSLKQTVLPGEYLPIILCYSGNFQVADILSETSESFRVRSEKMPCNQYENMAKDLLSSVIREEKPVLELSKFWEGIIKPQVNLLRNEQQ